MYIENINSVSIVVDIKIKTVWYVIFFIGFFYNASLTKMPT